MFPAGIGIFLFATSCKQVLWPAQPPIQCVPRLYLRG